MYGTYIVADQCQNSTGVTAFEIENAGSSSQTSSGNATGNGGSEGAKPSSAAGRASPVVATALFAAVMAWGLL